MAQPDPNAPSDAPGRRPPSHVQHFLYSGSRRDVMVGLLLVSVVISVPWFMLTSNTTHHSHADYMDQAEKARQARFSTSKSTP